MLDPSFTQKAFGILFPVLKCILQAWCYMASALVVHEPDSIWNVHLLPTGHFFQVIFKIPFSENQIFERKNVKRLFPWC